MTKTVKELKQLKKEIKSYRYFYKCRRWIDNYDIITCIRIFHKRNDNNKLLEEVLINLEIQINAMTEKLGKSQPWKAFKIIINTVIKACKTE